ncbi:MAG: toll/interleukin-1 receptor domain-containing protein [Oscillibacter sp.]|nr:toll/interleukin-1 receptor domain-containing protein [Oscillibacter sp.]
MAEVFISYHEASAGALAGEIAGRLDKAGISSWCARRDMPPGADFADEIPSQIDACRLFLLL